MNKRSTTSTVFAIFVLWTLSSFASAATSVSQNIEQDTVWDDAGSPYTLLNDIQIYPNVELSLVSATVVGNGHSFDVGGLLFVNTSYLEVATFSGQGLTAQYSYFDRCYFGVDTLEATSTIFSSMCFNMINSYLNNCTILAPSCPDHSGPFHQGTLSFVDSYVEDFYDSSTGWDELSFDAIEVISSRFAWKNPTTYATALTFNTLQCKLENSTFSLEGGNLDSLQWISPANGPKNFSAQGCVFSNLTHGLQLTFPSNGLVGVSLHGCSFVNYGSYSLVNYGPSPVNATLNWWGTNNATLIQQGIYDYHSNYNSGVVEFQPYLDAAPSNE